MIVLPNGIKIEMEWKQVIYIRNNAHVKWEKLLVLFVEPERDALL